MVAWTGSADPSEAGREAPRSRGPGSGYTRQRSTQQGLREMLGIEKVDHIGIRVSDKSVSIAFYERLGFKTLSDTGFEKGHPIIMQHPSGVVLNLLGPADTPNDKNILMDTDEKYPGTRLSRNVRRLAIYVQGRGALRRELTACLRTGRALRVPRARSRRRGKSFVSFSPSLNLTPSTISARR